MANLADNTSVAQCSPHSSADQRRITQDSTLQTSSDMVASSTGAESRRPRNMPLPGRSLAAGKLGWKGTARRPIFQTSKRKSSALVKALGASQEVLRQKDYNGANRVARDVEEDPREPRSLRTRAT